MHMHRVYHLVRKCLPDSLDQLTAWVTEKFSPVVNKNLQLPTFEGHPLTENELNVSQRVYLLNEN